MPPHPHQQSACQSKRRSLAITLFREIFALMVFAICALALTAYSLTRTHVRAGTFAQLQLIASVKEDLLQSTVAKHREEVSILAHDPALSSLPTVTGLIGFESLFTEDLNHQIALLVGPAPDLHTRKSLSAFTVRDGTSFLPIFSERGWEAYAIVVPLKGKAGSRLVALFQSDVLLEKLLSVTDRQRSLDILLGMKRGGDLLLLHAAHDLTAAPIFLGSYAEQLKMGSLLAKAVSGYEGAQEGRDYVGIGVFAAMRSIPSVGWGMVVQVDAHEVTAPLVRLALQLLIAGLNMVLILSFIVFHLSQHITLPLAELTRKLAGLEAKGWRFRRSIYTGNEIEEVDEAAFDLAGRLRGAYFRVEKLLRKRTQQVLAQHAQDDAVFRSIEYGIVVTSMRGEITFLNRAAQTLTGWTGGRGVGQQFASVLLLVDKDGHTLTAHFSPLGSVLHHRQRFVPAAERPLSLKRKDGSLLPISLRVMPLLKGARCFGAVAIFRDVTEDRRIDRMKSEFISLVSHQLRTPLSSMRWNIEMLESKESGPLSSEQRVYVREVAFSNQRMNRLVEALLTVSRIELKKFALKREKVTVREIVHRVELLIAPELKLKRLKIRYRAHGRPEAVVETDAEMLYLILENLIGNAVKYSRPKTTVDVRVKVEHHGTTITVTDRGIGIPDDAKRHLFEKMFRAKNAMESNTDGNGLGLYIARLAGESIGATLSYVSRVDSGTKFTVHIAHHSGHGGRTSKSQSVR